MDGRILPVAKRSIETMLVTLARRIRDEDELGFPITITISLETEHWDAKFVSTVEYDYEGRHTQ